MAFLRSLAAENVQDFIQNVTSVSNRYKNSFQGWKALATSCTIQLLDSSSKISSNQLSEIIVPFINKILGLRRVQLKPYVPPQFSNIQDFESWIENEKLELKSNKNNNFENFTNEKVEEFIESQLTKIIRKDYLEKASQTCQEIRCVMNNLTQAEQNLLDVAPMPNNSNSNEMITDMMLNNFDRFQGFFKESFIRVLNQRQSTLNEVQKIMLGFHQGDRSKTDYSIEDQLVFYENMKKTLEKRELLTGQYSTAIDEKVSNLTSANVIMEWALEAINDMEAILR